MATQPSKAHETQKQGGKMRINLTGHNVNMTPALNDYVQSKIGRLERRFDNVTSASVVLQVEKLMHKAEATIRVSGGELHADAVDQNMYAAIDALGDKLDRQITRHKEKLTERRRADSGRKIMES